MKKLRGNKEIISRKNRWFSLGAVVLLLAAGGLSGCGQDTAEPAEESLQEVLTDAETMEESDAYVDRIDRSAEGLTLVWNDEFDGEELDSTKWSFQCGTGEEYGLDGWGNAEEQYYTDRAENVKVEDGRLVITAIKEERPFSGKKYTSARLRTVTDEGDVLFATTYGRIEARIKMPSGEGLWPAFWMLPVDETIYGGWAASGEIDIMEARGRLPQVVGGTLHYGKVWPNNTYKGQDFTFPEDTDITDFHVYSLEWEPDELRWYVDDECFYTMDKWFSQGKGGGAEYTTPAPFDVPFYILLNMAVGGTFDSDANLENAEFPASMEVDFVRVYAKEAGYEPVANDAAAIDTRDTDGYAAYAASYEDGQFLYDPAFETMNTEAIRNTDTGIAADSKDWQFAVGNFGGAATACVEELDEGTFARIDITNGGAQSYAVQLIQHLPVVEGYSYEISFDARADTERSFVLSPSGDGDNSWVKYAVFDVSVGTELQSYAYTFKMNSVTDPTSRLEFNLGLKEGSVWIGNVQVRVMSQEGGVDPDQKKTPLYGGNLIYNGTFDQGAERLVFWHCEDLQAYVADYVLTETGEKDYSRMVELTADGEIPRIYQKGLQMPADREYALRFDLQGQEDTAVTVEVTSADGSEVYLRESCDYKSADGLKRFEFSFEGPRGVDDENAVFMITLPKGSKISLDNIKMNKKL